jgi:hypothetical protein
MMDPETIRELLQIVNETARPVYGAAHQRVIVNNTVGLVAGLLCMIIAVVIIISLPWEKGEITPLPDSVGFTSLLMITAMFVGLTIVVTSSINLLSVDYRTYQLIMALVR